MQQHTRQLFAALALACLPTFTWGACSGELRGQTDTHWLAVSDGGCQFSAEQIEVSTFDAHGAINEPSQRVPFEGSCTYTRRGLSCKADGKSLLSGTTYRWTSDTNPVCPGEKIGKRLTCIAQCGKAPKYLYASPYEC